MSDFNSFAFEFYVSQTSFILNFIDRKSILTNEIIYNEYLFVISIRNLN